MRTRHGMTLIELLVALSVFLVLGSSLVLFLRTGIDTWRVGEVRRESFERGQAILDQLVDDLRALHPDPNHGDGGEVDVLLVSDYDANLRQRLRFVRSLAGETRHPITRVAGSLTGGFADYDFENDAFEAGAGLLRAAGGLQEIAYIFDPEAGSELLWRGVRSPVGGERSLLRDENLFAEEGRVRGFRPFADGILYLEFNFWGARTTSWLGADGGVLTSWDSTRGIIPAENGTIDIGSRHEPRDDIFPSRVQVVLVLRPARAARFGRLTAPIGPTDTEITLDSAQHYPESAFPYIRIDDEWIRYTTIAGRTFLGCDRGVRGTEPADHAAMTPAIYGTSFSRVIRIPGVRESRWGER